MKRYLTILSTCVIVLLVGLAIATPYIGLPDPLAMQVTGRLHPPSAEHYLGQDEFGRDVLSRLLWGARTSLAVAGASAGLSFIVGSALGILAGYLGGALSQLILRGVDVILCLPELLLALLVITLFGGGIGTLIPVLALVFTPAFVRIAYAGTLAIRRQEFIEALKVLGAGRSRIMVRAIMPNIAGPLLIQLSLTAAGAIMLEAGLSFIGLGVLPPAPSWGQMIGSARAVMSQAPMLLVWPCLAMIVTVLAINGICDGLRNILDPRELTARKPRTGRQSQRQGGTAPDNAASLLTVSGLSIEIPTAAGVLRPVRDISLAVAPGETLAIVGESGSGKSLTGLAVAGLLAPGIEIASGSAWVGGQEVLGLSEQQRMELRGKTVAMVFQDPLSSLNPVHRIGDQIVEAIRAHQSCNRADARHQALKLLERVGIPDPERRFSSFPHEISGGMRQRVMIAIAIANQPRLLLADEPTTALDVTVQAQILELFRSLKSEQGMSMIFISHNLPVVAEVADRVAVMYAGEIVETGRVEEVFARPRHPYTAALLASGPGEDGVMPTGIPGVVPLPSQNFLGCAFAERCSSRTEICAERRPELTSIEADCAADRSTRCHNWMLLQ